MATKCDLEEERQVTFEEGNAIAKKYGMQFFEVSSKTGKNVHESFVELTREMKDRKELVPKTFSTVSENRITVNGIAQSKKKNCEC